MYSMEAIKAIENNLKLGIVSFSGFTIKTTLKNGVEKKDFKFPFSWKDITKDNCMEQTNGNVAIICGKKSGISVIDFDNRESFNQAIQDFPQLKDHKQVETKNGVHIYGLYNPDLLTTTNGFTKYSNVDIRNDDSIVVAPPTKYQLKSGTFVSYKCLGGDILEFPPEFIQLQKHLQKKKKENEKIQKTVQKKMEQEVLSNIDEVCQKIIEKGLLDDKCDDYNDWRDVGFAIFNSIHNYDLFNLFSKRSKNYDEDGVKKFWDGIKERLDNRLTMRSILYWAREKDADLYKSLNIADVSVTETDIELTFYRKSKLFERTHCKIISEGLFIHEENHEIKILNEPSIRTNYKHISCGLNLKGKPINFIDRWLVNNNEIRNKTTMGFHLKECPDDAYNLWTPFPMELIDDYTEKPEAIEAFKHHIGILCNHEEKIVDYVIHWIAYMIQYPELKSTMLVFVSKQGAGKNLFLSFIQKMIGNKKLFPTTTPSRDVWGNFNGQMVDAFLVNLNEISATELKNASGQIKALITDPILTINEKGVKPFKIHSYHHFIAFTNENEAVKPTKDDRRTCLIRSSDKLIKTDKTPDEIEEIDNYIAKTVEVLNDTDGIKTIYEWLKNIPDLSQFFNETIPLTDFHKTQSDLTITPIEAWLKDFIGFHSDKQTMTHTTNELYIFFKDWLKCNIPNYECSSIQFGVRLKNFNKTLITTKHTKVGNEKTFDIPKLLVLLKIVDEELDI